MFRSLFMLGLVAGAAALIAAPAAAQIPPELLNNTRRELGDTVRVCVDDHSPGGALDRRIALALGEALLLEVKFHPAPTGFPLNGAGYLEELQIVMSRDCDMLMGISVQANSPFPDWVTVTRPYATVPFVLMVTDPAFRTLDDIPRDRLIGTALGSKGEQVFLTWQQQQPEARRWGRLPYANSKLMLTRLRDGRLAGMILWQPAYLRLMAEDKEGGPALHSADFAPVPMTDVRVGALVSNRDSFLRNMVDEAIDGLVADGTIAAIMTEMGIAGHPGD